MKLGLQQYTIFILEDNEGHFHAIKNAINQYFQKTANSIRVKVLPELIDRHQENFRSWNYVIASIEETVDKSSKERALKEIVAYCEENDVDIFVLDNAIISDTDETGIEFANILISKAYNNMNFEIIIVSNAGQTDFAERFEKNFKYSFVPKESDNYPFLIVRHIDEMTSRENLNENGKQAIGFYSFKHNMKKFGFDVAFSFLWHYIKYNSPRIVDKVILIVFYVLIGLTTIYSGFQIIMQIFSRKKLDSSPNGETLTYGNDETHILTTVEHLFVYLLPIFILFGFFNYYKNNIRISFLEGNKTKIDEDHSTSAIRLSKILFVSSMIGFILVKTIEELFYQPQHFTNSKLIGAGALLVFLMLYFFLLEGENKKH